MLNTFIKRPTEQLDYQVDFERWLPDDDQIVTATAQIIPADAMVSAIRIDVQPESARVWLVDGVPGKSATVLVTATTAQGRIKQVEFQIRVKD